MRRVWTVALVTLFSSCGGGGDEEPHPIESGLYQLTTFEITGDCKLDWAISPEMEFVGKTLPVAVTSSDVSITVQICGHPDEAPECAGFNDNFSVARDGNTLVGEQPLWSVPGCGTTADYEATLLVEGEVTADDEVEFTWNATITSSDPTWECSGYHACSSTIKQRMALAQ
jgi:hypothetical protein